MHKKLKKNETRIRVRSLLLVTLVFSVFTNLLMLTGPLFMLQVYDRVLASRSEETLVALFGLVGVLYFFYWMIEYARGRVVSRVGARMHAALSGPAFRAVVERAARRESEASGGLQDVAALRNLFSSPVILALFDIPWTPLFLAAIFIFHPMLGWLAVAGGTILIVAAILNQLLTFRKTARAAEQAQGSARLARQAESSGEYVIAQGMRGAMQARWMRLEDAAVDQSMRASDWTGSFSAFIRAFRLFLQSAMLALGAWLVLAEPDDCRRHDRGERSCWAGRSPRSMWVFRNGRRAAGSRRLDRSIKALLNRRGAREPETVLPAPAADLDVRSVSLYLRAATTHCCRSCRFK
jgi:ABC-type protease/lipase transport system fused ATPase/permease subunit